MFTTTQAAPPAPVGDLFHGLPAGVDAACPCRPCRIARDRITDALADTRWGVPRFRAVRRVQALAAIGYTPDQLATILVCPVWELDGLMEPRIAGGGFPSRRLFARLFAAYEVLSARPLLEEADPRWPSPLAWDEPDDPDGIDNPDARPRAHEPEPEHYHDTIDPARVARIMAGVYVETTRAEKETATALWMAAGRTWADLERLTGWNVEKYTPAAVAQRAAEAAAAPEETAA